MLTTLVILDLLVTILVFVLLFRQFFTDKKRISLLESKLEEKEALYKLLQRYVDGKSGR